MRPHLGKYRKNPAFGTRVGLCLLAITASLALGSSELGAQTVAPAATSPPGNEAGAAPVVKQPPNSPTFRDSSWFGVTPLVANNGLTAISGHVTTTEGIPLDHVIVTDGTVQSTTDDQGRFLIAGVAPGTSVMALDAQSAGQKHIDYGYYEIQVTAVAGETTVLPYTSWLPKIDHANEVKVPSPTTSEVVITNPELPGLQFRLPQGAILTGVDHKPVRKVSITRIPVDRTPFPLPPNVKVPLYFTVQPGGTVISSADGKWLGAQVWYPNFDHQLPKATASFFRYDPYGLGWTIYGQGTVSDDGIYYVPDANTRVYDFTSAMINAGNSPPTVGPPASPCNCAAGEPVDLATGLWVENATDLSLSDVVPITMVRTYRQGDTNARTFGVGMTLNYDAFLWSANQYQEVDLITPEGGRVHYTRISSGTGFTDAVFLASTAPGAFFHSTIRWNATYAGWDLIRTDGTTYVFPEYAPLRSIVDRYGNGTFLTRSGGPSGPITGITSTNGRSISLTYTSGVITQAQDNSGRTVTYTYDGSKRLQTVTDPDGGVTTFTWNTTTNRITSVQYPNQHPSGPQAVANTYDANGRVHIQTLPDSSTWQFDYTLNGSGKVTATDVTDPDGNVRKVTFNTDGYWLTQKFGFGSAVEQDYTAVRGGSTPPADCTANTAANSPTNHVIGLTDALGRLSCWTYDSGGQVLTAAKLAGTADQVTTSYTYDDFEQLTQISDPLGHTKTISRDAFGRPTAFTDGESNVWPIVANSDGTIASITDPLTHATAFTYDHGVLATLTDPLSRVVTQYSDGVGRPIRSTDPLAALSQWDYDPIWGVHLATDANANVVTTNYDAGGLVSSIVDPRSTGGSPILTQYAYDTQDRLTTRTDPLSRDDTINTYDHNGNVLTATDRNGQDITLTWDALNRIASATYDDGHVVAYTWDDGSRLTDIDDTVGGVTNAISRTYDGLDRLTEESVVQGATTLGTVDYTWDDASRPDTMTVSGQSAVTYTFDDANRLTDIVQGGAHVIVAWDDASRRETLTLPNGIVATYGYDDASELTSLSYDKGGSNVGTLTYTYDAAGRIVARGGTLFQSILPAAQATTAYNADNQLTTWGAATLTYDDNGNLTNDGTNSLTWDARNRLTALGSVASFVYDGVDRRQSIAKSGTTVTTVYDRYSPVQEKVGGSVLADLLTGLGIDERFTRTESGTTSTFLTDLLGSTTALTNASGVIQTSYGYDAYGVATASGTSSDNPYQFTGRNNDGTGLYYYRARYYNPTWGRFVSEDPIGLAAGVNVYTYVAGAPISETDGTGRNPVLLGGELGAEGGSLIWPGPGTLIGGVLGAGVGLLIGDEIASLVFNSKVPDLPTGIVGDNPRQSSGKRTNTDLPASEFPGKIADLTGGELSDLLGGDKLCPNGVRIRQGRNGQGPRIDIPANGPKPPEGLHFPPGTPWPW
jgi:RHS repeat-associated protein